MKSFTRVGLPILLVIGIVFGITFMSMYTTDDGQTEGGGQGKAGPTTLPLDFKVTVATPLSLPASGEIKDVPPQERHMFFWESSIEVGSPGHFEFWCANRNTVPVAVRVPKTNCQCAGVEIAVIPMQAHQEYILNTMLAGSPLCPAVSPLSAFAHLRLSRSLDWKPLNKDRETYEQIVPAAASAKAPQWAVVRVGWSGKGEPGKKEISAELYSNMPDGVPVHTPLAANTLVVPSFDIVQREGAQRWIPSREVSFGDLRENGVSRRDVFFVSSSRPYFIYSISSDTPDPCITWDDPVPASREEMTAFLAYARGIDESISRMKSLYKATITIRERVEIMKDGKKDVHNLNLGVLEQKLRVKAVEAGAWPISIKGRVLGDIGIASGAETGKIEFGNAIPADQDSSRDVILTAERADLGLKLIEKECTPSYLKLRFDELEPIEGRKRWRLRVTIPKNSIPGTLPDSSAIILETIAPNPRRMTIPVRATTVDAGGPRL